MKSSIITKLRNYFLAGIVTLIPILITAYLTILVVDLFSNLRVFNRIPDALLIVNHECFHDKVHMCLRFKLNLCLNLNCYIFLKTFINCWLLAHIYPHVPSRFFFPWIFPKLLSSCFEVSLHFKLDALFWFRIANFS